MYGSEVLSHIRTVDTIYQKLLFDSFFDIIQKVTSKRGPAEYEYVGTMDKLLVNGDAFWSCQWVEYEFKAS